MIGQALLMVMFLVMAIPAGVSAHTGKGNVVDVRVLSDHGGELSMYRTYPRTCPDGTYFYMEAVKNERYSIQVKNTSAHRIGVVIAVDGRNIISGKKSDLTRSERMYILNPYETNTFEGWRTGTDRTNRFYFTEQSDSYAEKAFSDASAMGTIAIAVYTERVPHIMPYSGNLSGRSEAPAAAAPGPSMESRSADRAREKKTEQAGTGFGETTYSPVYTVHFNPEHSAAQTIVLKYEWRSELCKKGVIGCRPKNRFWPDGQGFAPIPGDFRG